MIKIGVTGGIGSGKSTVCAIFQSMGIPIYFADDEAKKLYDTDESLKKSLLIHFGDQIYPNGKFDKKALGKIVFSDATKLKLLNHLVHPIVQKQSENWFSVQEGVYAIKEAALLIESESYKQVDKIIVVHSPLELRIQRIMQRDSVSEQEVALRMSKQLSDEERIKFADFVIQNDNQHLLIPQVISIHKQLMNF